jgi:ribosomal protein S18 acetylase RimI-like enzyme
VESIAELDLLMASAWPAAQVGGEAGWQCRFTEGITRRANSALAVGEPDDLEAAIEAAERFYAGLSAPPVFYVSEASSPEPLADALATRGYTSSATTWILWAETDTVVAATSASHGWPIHASGEAGDAWFDTYWAVEAGRRFSAAAAPVFRDVLLRPQAPATFVSALDSERKAEVVVAVGQAVIQDRWGCVQCLATRPEARRRGAATAVLSNLAAEAGCAGADRIYAAVMADNPASLGLFEGASFRRSHRYCYFSRRARAS